MNDPDMDALIDIVLQERNWPCNPKAAARAGWEARDRLAKSVFSPEQARRMLARQFVEQELRK